MDKKILIRTTIFVSIIFLIFASIALIKIWFWRFTLISYILFLATYYSFHVLIKKYSLKINNLTEKKFRFEIKSLIFCGSHIVYIINAFILEGVALLTDNFWDGLSCRGPWCVISLAYWMYIPYLIFIVIEMLLFTGYFCRNTKFVKQDKKGIFSKNFFYVRSIFYLIIGFLFFSTIIYLWLNMSM